MKKILFFILLIVSIQSFAQPTGYQKRIVNERIQGSFMVDSAFNIPRYYDTTVANLHKRSDSCGAMFFAYAIDSIYYRACNPKRWIVVGSGGSSGTASKSVLKTGSDFTLVNDITTPKKGYFYGAKPLLDSARGYYEIEENFYGKIYDSSSWNNTTGFVVNGATVSVVSNKLSFSGGAGTFTQVLSVPYASQADNWKMAAKVKVSTASGTSFGFGLGKKSINTYGDPSAIGRFNMSTVGTTGNIVLNGGTAETQLNASARAVSFSNNDYILLTVERIGYIITVSARNITTNSSQVDTSYTFNPSTGADPFIDNTGYYSIYSFGGAFTVDSLAISSQTPKNARLAIIGDSKTQGYIKSTQSKRLSDLLNNNYKSTINLGGGFDRTIDVSKRTQEIINLRPQQVIMNIGSNDVREAGESSATYYARYDSITNALTAAGIDVYHIVMYESSVSLTGLRDHIVATFPTKYINVYDPMRATGALNADNVHPNDYGDSIAYYTIINSGKLYGGNTRYGTSSSSGGGSSQWITTGSDIYYAAGKVAIGTASPAYQLDVRNISASQGHFTATTSDDGTYIYGSGNTGLVSSGSAFNGSNWIAKSTSSHIIGGSAGGYNLYINTGLTPGNSFTPTSALSLTPTDFTLPTVTSITGTLATSLSFPAATSFTMPSVKLGTVIATDAPFTSGIIPTTDFPYTSWYRSTNGTNEKVWDIAELSNTLNFRIVNDALSAANNWMTVTRTAHTTAKISFPIDSIYLSEAIPYSSSASIVHVGIDTLITSPTYGKLVRKTAGGSETDPLSIHLTGTSTLTGNATVATGSNTLTVSTGTSAITPMNVTSTTGAVLVLTNTTEATQAMTIQKQTSVTNDVANGISILHTTSGTAAAEFGIYNSNRLENAGGSPVTANQFITKWQRANAGSEASQYAITGISNGITDTLSTQGGYVNLTESSATTFTTTTVASGKIQGGLILVTIEANNGTEFQARTMRVIWVAENKAGTMAITLSTPEEVVAASSGTLTATLAGTDAGSGLLQFTLNAVSSLTQTTLRCSYQTFKNF